MHTLYASLTYISLVANSISILRPLPHPPPSPLQLRTLHSQKLTQPLERLLRLRRRQMLHGLEQMRRHILIQIHPRRASMRYRLRRRLLRRRAGMWAVARRRWRRGLDDWRGCGCRRRGLDGGLEVRGVCGWQRDFGGCLWGGVRSEYGEGEKRKRTSCAGTGAGAESAISTSAAAGVPFVIGVSGSETVCAGLGDGSAILRDL